MEQKRISKQLMTKIIIAVAVVVLAVTATILYFAFKEKPNYELKTVSLVIYFSEEENYSYELTTEKGYVFDLLEEFNESKELGFTYDTDATYGAFITGLKGKINENGYYLMYTINDGFDVTGISSQVIKDGDIIKFTYDYWG